MKILQVIPYFCFGGAETMCENLTYALRQQGHQVTVVSLYNERTPIARRMEAAGVEIRYLDKKLGLDLSMVPKLRRIMAEVRPDAVHTHLDVIKYAVAAARLAGIRHCVHTVHNVADKEAEGRLQKIINGTYFKLGWSVPVALSHKVQQSICEFYGLPEKKVPIIFNGIDLSRCRIKEEYASEIRNLLHIGRFNEQKNHDCLLRSFQLILKKHPDCTLTLLGDGELTDSVKALAKELGIEDQVKFMGAQSDVYPFLQEADAFLLPSRYEGMPMTVIEAMGTGLPIAAAAVGGLSDMLDQRGRLVKAPVTPESFAQAVEELMEDPDRARNLGISALRGSHAYSAEYMAMKYCDVYEK